LFLYWRDFKILLSGLLGMARETIHMRQTGQRLAEVESKLARLREQTRKDHTRQMILLGATIFAEAQRAPGFRAWLTAKLESSLKPADEGAIRRLVERIQSGAKS
jgi:hypothetical protein